jgi:hypothetical protein
VVRSSRNFAAVVDSPGSDGSTGGGTDASTNTNASTNTGTDDRTSVDTVARRVRTPRAWLLASAVVVGLVHYWIADPQSGPRIFADEIGYLADARYLAGGPVIDMSHTAFYAGGFSLVIAPLSRLFAHNPGHLYESVIVLQAILAGVSVVMIAHVCRWLFATRWSVAIVAALVAGLYPAFVINTGFTWSESMLAFALLVAVTAVAWVLRSLDRQPLPQRAIFLRSALAGAACAYVVTVHNRTVLAMVAAVALLGVALVLRKAARATIFLGAGFILVAGAGQVLNKHLNKVLWHGAGGVDASSDVTDLLHPHGLWLASRAAIGQYWYQFVATGGIIAIALTALVLLALRNRRTTLAASAGATLSSSRSTFATVLVVIFAGLLAVATVFLANGNRADAIVYGRYLDIATPLLVAIGITWLCTLPSPRSLGIAATVVVASSASWIVLHFGARLELARPYNRATTMGTLGWLNPHNGGIVLFDPTVWAVAIALVAATVSFVVRRQRASRWIATIAIAGAVVSLFSWQLSFAHRALLNSLAAGAADTHATVQAVHDSGATELTLDKSITVVDRLALAFWLPSVKLVESTPAIAACSRTVSISHAARPAVGEVHIRSGGVLYLFRGTHNCP